MRQDYQIERKEFLRALQDQEYEEAIKQKHNVNVMILIFLCSQVEASLVYQVANDLDRPLFQDLCLKLEACLLNSIVLEN